MSNLDISNNVITLEAIASSLSKISTALSGFATKDDLDSFATRSDLDKFATKDDLSSFATRSDLDKFVTKDDLDSFATRSDLEKFATKDDLSSFATRSDLEKFATREDLSSFSNQIEDLIDSLAITTTKEISKLETKIDSLEQKVDRNHNYTVNQLDHIMLHYARREEYQYYGERLKKLERKVFA